jgi:peptidoglycan/xylan/chitin deacetylase (PgdA/CDA1 family)
MYHGVAEDPVDAWTQLARARFEEQMEFVARHFRVVPLDEVVDRLRDGRQPEPGSLVITFDDGFRNNLTHASPVLAARRLPAIIYLTTSLVDGDPRFAGLIWTDYLLALLQGTRASEVDASDLGLGLGRLPLNGAAARRRAKDVLGGALKRVDPEVKNRALDVLGARLGPVLAELRERLGGLSWDEVRRLADEGLVEFGAHTVNHEILTRLSLPAAAEEIEASKRRIEEVLGREVRHFAYPNGTRADYNDEIKSIAARLFASAVTTEDGINDPRPDLFELRRVNVGSDLPLDEFKLRVCGLWPAGRA